MDYSLAVSCAALLLAVIALWRAYVPPQTRAVFSLTGRVEDLEAAHEDVRERLTKRAKQENMAKARDEIETRRERRDAIEQQALEVLQAAKAAPAAPQLPLDPDLARRELRAKLMRH